MQRVFVLTASQGMRSADSGVQSSSMFSFAAVAGVSVGTGAVLLEESLPAALEYSFCAASLAEHGGRLPS